MTIKMADVSRKQVVRREAVAVGEIRLKPETVELIRLGKVEKGDPIQIATITGIQGSKLTPLMMPLCHPLQIEASDVKCELKDTSVRVKAKVLSFGRTGVEMEALAAVSVALLNIWDVVKKYEKDKRGQYRVTEITGVRVLKKEKRKIAGL